MKAVAVFCEGQYFSLDIHVSCCHLDVAAPAVAGAVVAETLGGVVAHDGEGVAPVHYARSVAPSVVSSLRLSQYFTGSCSSQQ